MSKPLEYDRIVLPVYVINLETANNKLLHIQEQFKHKHEFEINIVAPYKHADGSLALWQSIVNIAKTALRKNEDVIIICEDNHKFTEHYSKENLVNCIIEASEMGVKLLLGGVARFINAVPISNDLCWVDNFSGSQFVVVFSQFFAEIPAEHFVQQNDTVDEKFSEMTSNKMVLFPFISVQKDFGDSDPSSSIRNNMGLSVEQLFEYTHSRLTRIYKARNFYKKFDVNSQK